MSMRIFMVLPLSMLAACTVGPDYKGPPILGVAAPPPAFVRAGDIPVDQPASGRWWSALNDPVLDDLERRALAENPDMRLAEARIAAARASLRLERANTLPNASAQLSSIQAKLPGLDLGGQSGAARDDSLAFYYTGFDASWEIDLFGGQRRKLEAARAGLAAIEADAATARLRLSAEVALAYVGLRDRQQRLLLAQRVSALQRQSLMLIEQRFEQGTASILDVERFRISAETSDADLAPLIADTESQLNAIAILLGSAPGSLDAVLASPASIPPPPAHVTIGDPGALLQRRPDIRAAERRLAADTARIGVARSSRFPRVKLMGMIGLGGTEPSDLFDADKLAMLAAPSLQWDLLDFGRGASRVRQAEARRDEAEAAYRIAVLVALRDAEDAVARFGHRRTMVATLARALGSASRAAALTHQRFDAGTATKLDMLEADHQQTLAEQRLSTATAALTSDFIALQKALGLGWNDPAP